MPAMLGDVGGVDDVLGVEGAVGGFNDEPLGCAFVDRLATYAAELCELCHAEVWHGYSVTMDNR